MLNRVQDGMFDETPKEPQYRDPKYVLILISNGNWTDWNTIRMGNRMGRVKLSFKSLVYSEIAEIARVAERRGQFLQFS